MKKCFAQYSVKFQLPIESIESFVVFVRRAAIDDHRVVGFGLRLALLRPASFPRMYSTNKANASPARVESRREKQYWS